MIALVMALTLWTPVQSSKAMSDINDTFNPDTDGCLVHLSPAPICRYPPLSDILILPPVIVEPFTLPPDKVPLPDKLDALISHPPIFPLEACI